MRSRVRTYSGTANLAGVGAFVDTNFILPSDSGPDGIVRDPFAIRLAGVKLRGILRRGGMKGLGDDGSDWGYPSDYYDFGDGGDGGTSVDVVAPQPDPVELLTASTPDQIPLNDPSVLDQINALIAAQGPVDLLTDPYNNSDLSPQTVAETLMAQDYPDLVSAGCTADGSGTISCPSVRDFSAQSIAQLQKQLAKAQAQAKQASSGGSSGGGSGGGAAKPQSQQPTCNPGFVMQPNGTCLNPQTRQVVAVNPASSSLFTPTNIAIGLAAAALIVGISSN